MRARSRQPIRWGLVALAALWMLVIVPLSAAAAPYAALVMDARSGEVLHSRNADTPLHPASLTKMMTLYIVFEAVENGEIGLDDRVKISSHAASEPPSKLGLRAGQSIRLRYLIRAAAVKSANDAATALGEAIEGSEARFAQRMNRTAKALGMKNTTFKNAHGLTESGHLSTARDMSILGRHVFYDYPEYYNLFSRITADAGVRKVYHTNRKLLRSYKGADGIKTGYTRAAGFNLVASAERDGKRIIATVFGGRSTASRNAKVAELLDLGFRRSKTRVALHKPAKPPYMGRINGDDTPGGYGKKVRLAGAAAVKSSLRPKLRPATEEPAPILVADKDDIENAVLAAQEVALAETEPEAGSSSGTEAEEAELAPEADSEVLTAALDVNPEVTPEIRPESIILASREIGEPNGDPEQEIVERVSTSGGRHWGITVGRYPSQYKARKVLLQIALNEMSTLDGSLRKVLKRTGGYDANFMGMTRETAELACRRLQAKKITCFMIEPTG
ncbi:D-alanyl-D-alanine carboxypeptidase family protein [Roseovarius indicus]|uniref:D-Ala-D-Ala carboxypeptidase n=1 Tax=Roseovarius indicus TaxID=540747 RepID=A0A0T5P1G7_9RHOB|nr:D-alanyl-D-alanine carboxypeptidase family protein [Roseovarius indicus]KRS14950.1 D-Ala-D-Ala carboxypeptidase [Roseovarius indicus]QEW24396.1 D-alanyl-D-alanine carboxypeptidase DacF precursor [Roseovarius indicus]SFD71262.1 D-alanyl-D-alanine carboxypeptidase [Roseovarius indicus]